MESGYIIITLWLLIGTITTYYTELKPALRKIEFGLVEIFTLADLLELVIGIIIGPIQIIRYVLDKIKNINLFKIIRTNNGKIKIG